MVKNWIMCLYLYKYTVIYIELHRYTAVLGDGHPLILVYLSTFFFLQEGTAEYLVVNGMKVRVFHEKDPAQIPWGQVGAMYVCESTGVFCDKDGASGSGHILFIYVIYVLVCFLYSIFFSFYKFYTLFDFLKFRLVCFIVLHFILGYFTLFYVILVI